MLFVQHIYQGVLRVSWCKCCGANVCVPSCQVKKHLEASFSSFLDWMDHIGSRDDNLYPSLKSTRARNAAATERTRNTFSLSTLAVISLCLGSWRDRTLAANREIGKEVVGKVFETFLPSVAMDNLPIDDIVDDYVDLCPRHEADVCQQIQRIWDLVQASPRDAAMTTLLGQLWDVKSLCPTADKVATELLGVLAKAMENTFPELDFPWDPLTHQLEMTGASRKRVRDEDFRIALRQRTANSKVSGNQLGCLVDGAMQDKGTRAVAEWLACEKRMFGDMCPLVLSMSSDAGRLGSPQEETFFHPGYKWRRRSCIAHCRRPLNDRACVCS